MCLSTVDSPEQMKEYLRKKPTIITAYKVVRHNRRHKRLQPSIWNSISFRRGRNISRASRDAYAINELYTPYFHSFSTQRIARGRAGWSEKIIPVKINKKDITVTGFQDASKRKKVIVSKRIYIDPKVYDKALNA